MDISIESIRVGDEEQRHDLRRQAFGGTDEFDPEAPVVESERIVSAYAGDSLVGTVVTLPFQMWWGGRPVPCGGVSGVVIRPEMRGRGLAKAMLRESFDRMLERGEVTSALYPTTSTLYRSVGYEVGGFYRWRKVALDLLPPVGDDDLDWRRVSFDDPAIARVHDAMAPSIDGFISPGPLWWTRVPYLWSREKGTNRYAYVGSRGEDDVATVVYKYTKSDDRLYELSLDLLAGTDGPAVRSALAFLAGNGTTAGHVTTTLPTALLARHIAHMQLTKADDDWPWMLRLVDARAAMAGRRIPASVAGRVEIDVADEVIPLNAAAHVLEIGAGSAALVPGGSGRVRIPVTALAAIYAGADVRAMATAGTIAGATAADVDLLAAAFVSTPAMPFFF